jgi:hypothetical protein
MSGHYSYNLSALAAQGSNPLQPVFTNPFAYRACVTVMDALEADTNSPVPQHSILLAAKNHAKNIRDKRVPYPAELEENTYNGVDHDDMPKSKEITAEAQLTGPTGRPITYFDDFLTAEFYRGTLRPNKRVEDATIPQSKLAMQAHVDLLVRAFKSTISCDDNPPIIKPFEERRHDSKLVECLCWSIVKACVSRAKSDEPLLTAHEPHKARNSLGLDTFEKRFDAVALTLARSKTICKHLYDAPYINTFVDDPLRSIRRVDANRELNKQKADVMAKGKALDQQQTGTVPGKKTRTTRKRSATSAGLDSEQGSRVQTPPTALTDSARLTQSLPANGRVTRRMSRLMAEVENSPFGTPSTLRSQIISSPMSSSTDIKNESSPLRNHQGYGMNGYNVAQFVSTQGNGYDQTLMEGINFPGPRFTAPMGTTYPWGGAIARGPYANGMNYMSPSTATTGMHYRGGPMVPEEVTMSAPVSYFPWCVFEVLLILRQMNRFYTSNPFNDDVDGEEDTGDDDE